MDIEYRAPWKFKKLTEYSQCEQIPSQKFAHIDTVNWHPIASNPSAWPKNTVNTSAPIVSRKQKRALLQRTQIPNEYSDDEKIVHPLYNCPLGESSLLILAAVREFKSLLIDRILVKTTMGSIEVIGENRSTILLKIMKSMDSRLNFERKINDLQVQGNGLIIQDDIRPTGDSQFKYALFVPIKKLRAKLKTTQGSIRMYGCLGSFNVKSRGNLVEVEEFKGKCEIAFGAKAILKNISGNVKACGRGSLDAYTINSNLKVEVDGDVFLDTVTGTLNALSSYGSIQCIRTIGSTTAITANGSIAVYDAGGSIQAKSLNGDIFIKLHDTNYRIFAKSQTGSISIRAPEIIPRLIRTKSGCNDVTLEELALARLN